MKFVVKYFSEIAIKSKPVRRRFVTQLGRNLLAVLHEIDPEIQVRRQWDRLAEEELSRVDVEVLAVPLAGSTVIDIRHPEEAELSPLELPVPVVHIPFYQLHSRAAELSAGSYMLYCGKGVMSRLHASHLLETADLDLKVYAP